MESWTIEGLVSGVHWYHSKYNEKDKYAFFTVKGLIMAKGVEEEVYVLALTWDSEFQELRCGTMQKLATFASEEFVWEKSDSDLTQRVLAGEVKWHTGDKLTIRK